MENVNFNCNVCQHSWNDDPMEVNECPNCGSDDFNQSGGGGFFKKNLKLIIIILVSIFALILGSKFLKSDIENINAIVKCEKNKLIIEVTGDKNKVLENNDFEFSLNENGRYFPLIKFNCLKIKEKEEVFVRSIKNNDIKTKHKIRWFRIDCCAMIDLEEEDECDFSLMLIQDPTFNCPNLKVKIDNIEECEIFYSLNDSTKQKSNSFTIDKNVKLAKVKVFDKEGTLIAQKEVQNECFELPKVNGVSSCDSDKLKRQYTKLIEKVFKNPDNSNLSIKLENAFVSSTKKLVVSNNGNESIQDLVSYLINENIFAGSVFTPSITLEMDINKCKIKKANITW